MQALLDVILPVFLVIGIGYLCVWRGVISASASEGVMQFATGFAVPLLIFQAISTLDLQQNFQFNLLFSFYVGAVSGFVLGYFGARKLFDRGIEDSIAIGFCCLFSNSMLLGVPISERAFGAESLSANFAIIAIHSPICYAIGITAMELAKSTGTTGRQKANKVFKSMFSNPLVLACLSGALFNIFNLSLPTAANDAIAMIARAGLPAALFGIGGILSQYRPEGDLRVTLYVCCVSLVLHPAITFAMGKLTGLSLDPLRSAVITASMAPGVNAFIFANLYGHAKRVAATSVLIATTISILTIWVWLHVLP